MTASAPSTAERVCVGPAARPVRLAFLGEPAWLATCCPPTFTAAYGSRAVPLRVGGDVEGALGDVQRFAPHVTVVIDPRCLPAEALRVLPGTTLGILVGTTRSDTDEGPGALDGRLAALDRVVSFRPALTGSVIGGRPVWRAIPPPIADVLYGDVRPLHRRPSAMTIGRSTTHRDDMLLAAKHHHDLLEVVHGVTGEDLVELLREYDAGVYVPREPGAGFGAQVGIHLAAGQLLFAHSLHPAHGLERGIDYLSFNTASELVALLDRLARFPEMYQRVRLRGRMKAEHYRASRVFERIAHDVLLDVAAFGELRSGG